MAEYPGLIIGFHIDGKDAKTLGDKFTLAEKSGAGVFQCFMHPPQQSGWTGAKVIPDADCAQARQSSVAMATHSPYILNPAGPYNEAVAQIILDDLRINNLTAGIGTVIHPGTNTARYGLSTARAEATVAENINRMLRSYCRVNPAENKALLLIENNAAETNKLFHSVDRLGWLYSQIQPDLRRYLGFCLDTQHLFASGYDLRQPAVVRHVFDEFHRLIGLGNLELVHLNDSKVPFGTARDRHQILGQGHIFDPAQGGSHDGLREIIHACQTHQIPMVCETKEEHPREMALVRRLATK